MDIQAIVSLDRTECAVQCNSKKRILEIIADIAAKNNENIDQATVLNSLMSRERMGSTGIGNGIALPPLLSPVRQPLILTRSMKSR